MTRPSSKNLGMVCIAVGVLLIVAGAVTSPTRQARAAECPSGNGVVTSHGYQRNGAPVSSLDGLSQGDTVDVRFTIATGCSAQVSLASYEVPPSGAQQLSASDTGTFGGGTHRLRVVLPNCSFQVDFARGPVLNTVGPPGSGNYYGARLIGSGMGGTAVCASTTTTTTSSTSTTSSTTSTTSSTTTSTTTSSTTSSTSTTSTTVPATTTTVAVTPTSLVTGSPGGVDETATTTTTAVPTPSSLVVGAPAAASPGAPPPATGRPATLPATGSGALPLVLLGALALVLGLGLVVSSRRSPG